MALPSTIYKLSLGLSNMDTGYYAEHALTLARHPSETEERLMVRIFAFAMFASEFLEFGRGLSCVEDADLWERSLTGELLRWIDVGQPDLKRVKRALSQAREVVVLSYGSRSTDAWWAKEGAAISALERVTVYRLDAEHSAALTALCKRTMQYQCMIQEGEYCIGTDEGMVQIRPQVLTRTR